MDSDDNCLPFIDENNFLCDVNFTICGTLPPSLATPIPTTALPCPLDTRNDCEVGPCCHPNLFFRSLAQDACGTTCCDIECADESDSGSGYDADMAEHEYFEQSTVSLMQACCAVDEIGGVSWGPILSPSCGQLQASEFEQERFVAKYQCFY